MEMNITKYMKEAKYIGIIEIEEDYFEIIRLRNRLYACSATNVCVFSHYSIKWDYNYTDEENYEEFIEYLTYKLEETK